MRDVKVLRKTPVALLEIGPKSRKESAYPEAFLLISESSLHFTIDAYYSTNMSHKSTQRCACERPTHGVRCTSVRSFRASSMSRKGVWVTCGFRGLYGFGMKGS